MVGALPLRFQRKLGLVVGKLLPSIFMGVKGPLFQSPHWTPSEQPSLVQFGPKSYLLTKVPVLRQLLDAS